MRVGVHESVEAVFPPSELVDVLSGDATDDVADGPGAGASVDAEATAADVSATVVGDDPDALAACDAVVTFVHRDAYLASVDWVHSIQAGVDRFPFEAFEDAGVALTNSTGIHGESVGETVVGYLTALARGLHRYRSAQERGEWIDLDWDRPFTLAGERCCVVGLGTIGEAVAERAAALGMDVVGVRRSAEPVPAVEAVYPPEDLHEALSGARFVVLAVPLTPETRGLVGPAELDAMPEDAYLVNVARGAVVDEGALVEALEAGDLAGAALDVFEEEPLPADSPLWGREDVLVTPHSAGTTRTYHEAVAGIVLDNVERRRDGRELRNRVV